MMTDTKHTAELSSGISFQIEIEKTYKVRTSDAFWRFAFVENKCKEQINKDLTRLYLLFQVVFFPEYCFKTCHRNDLFIGLQYYLQSDTIQLKKAALEEKDNLKK